jgi:hypothetical protein
MATVPSRVAERLAIGIRRFQPILSSAKARDAAEADTATIVKDMLSELFGYDKYSEITSEFAIKSTYCDLAIRLEGKLQLLIEVKAIGLDLKDTYTKQAVDYAAHQGIEWVVLTNGIIWRIYRIFFSQPLAQELVFECDLLSVNPKNRAQIESLFLLAKEGQIKSVLDEYHAQRQAMSRYFLGAMVLSEPVVELIRREPRRISPGVRIDIDDLRTTLIHEVLKREVVEGEKAVDARKKISRAQARATRVKVKAATAGQSTDADTSDDVDGAAVQNVFAAGQSD